MLRRWIEGNFDTILVFLSSVPIATVLVHIFLAWALWDKYIFSVWPWIMYGIMLFSFLIFIIAIAIIALLNFIESKKLKKEDRPIC